MTSEILVNQTFQSGWAGTTEVNLIVELGGRAARTEAGGHNVHAAVALNAIAFTNEIAKNNWVCTSIE